ncbi:MAG: pyruvate dehydrogenase (acetyl-transferring), homodimeric type, partial [Planctomycetota bacterium]
MSHLIPQPLPDADPQETREWIESLAAVLAHGGRERARFIVQTLLRKAANEGFMPPGPLVTAYVNSVPVEDEPAYPGDLAMEKRIQGIVRWNAAAMVHRANTHFDGIGGHLSSYASASTLYEVAFNWFFRGKEAGDGGDQVYFQGHISPGLYARSYLEGFLDEGHLDRFRREVERGKGLSSYPHPRLMPDYWEFPTVSMGLGPLCAIYQARFNRYLHARGLADTSRSRVWAFLGDGECDEPESLGSLSVASREGLDNLTFVVNCNLQRLDGPVRGNGQIVQELEAVFRGAGWNVVKVLWSSEWDELFARDDRGLLREYLTRTVDGAYQKYSVASAKVRREEWFSQHPGLLKLIEDFPD